MNFKRLNLEGSRYSGTLPEYLCRMIDNNDAFVVGAEEGSNIVGLSVISFSDNHPDEGFLEYIFVEKAFRKKNVSLQLLEYCANLIKGQGAKCLNTKACGDKKFIKSLYALLLRARFVPVTFNGHVITYQTEDIRNGKFVEKLTGARELLPEVIKIKDRSDLRLRRFAEKTGRRGIFFNRKTYDEVFSRFYLENNEIRAMIIAKQIDPVTVFIENLYVDPGTETKFVNAVLLAEVLNEVTGRLSENESKVVIQAYDNAIYNAVVSALGNGTDDLVMQEYVRPLRR